jgi:glycosyltransferase involved in cell wall biosynthesis
MAVTRHVPYVASPHGGLDPFQRRHGRLRKRVSWLLWQREMLERAALIHVTTQAESDLIADIAPQVPRSVVPCAVHTQEFAELPARERFRNGHLNGYDGPLVLFLSRLTYKKGLDALVRAFAYARRELECRLAIAGPDDEGLRPSLERLASTLGVGADVHFCGPLYGDERLAALASAEVWALPSYTENFGIAVVEALAAGRAVVISPAVNISADMAAAEAGLVADMSPQGFGGALVEVLTNDGCRAALQSQARSFAQRYDWRVVAPQLVEMYREAASADR